MSDPARQEAKVQPEAHVAAAANVDAPAAEAGRSEALSAGQVHGAAPASAGDSGHDNAPANALAPGAAGVASSAAAPAAAAAADAQPSPEPVAKRTRQSAAAAQRSKIISAAIDANIPNTEDGGTAATAAADSRSAACPPAAAGPSGAALPAAASAHHEGSQDQTHTLCKLIDYPDIGHQVVKRHDGTKFRGVSFSPKCA